MSPTVRTGREKEVRTRIAKALRERGAWVVTYSAAPYGTAGTPDLLCCYRGRFLGLEVKRPGGAGPTPAQLAQQALIRKAGGGAAVVRSVDEALECLAEVDLVVDRAERRIG